MKSSLVAALQLYPRQSKQLAYGTAGFRENASLPLNSVFLRMGILGGLRSQSVGSKCIGLMVTASHNPECDNGVKLVDHDGGMMTQSWEPYAIEIANIAEPSDVVAAIDRIAATAGVTDPSTPSVIVIGRDTRPHSAELAECITKGAKAFGAVVFDMGLVTTPQLHFIVQQANKKATKFPISTLDRTAALQEYYDTIGAGYINLRDSASFTVEASSAQVCRSLSDVIVVDGSNGIGSIAIKETAAAVNVMRPGLLHVDIRNEAYAGPVNEGCGAEFVQKGQLPPNGVSKDTDSGLTMCSFDGDADRIVFHSYLKTEGSAGDSRWVLLDGDKIAAVMSVLIARELEASGLDKEYHMGVVQTAYANGASTMFLKENKVTVVMAKTGVKFLHHKALHFDIGVYFEANGHGTVLFSEKLLSRLDSWVDPDVNSHDRALVAMRRLKACTKVINQAVGDAISDMLMTLATLQILNMDVPAWNAIYTDLPSKQLKVPVTATKKDQIQCNEDETRLVSPTSLQQALDSAMSSTPKGRCFVRPSGTEDVVRVYAEAATQELADGLAQLAVKAINDFIHS